MRDKDIESGLTYLLQQATAGLPRNALRYEQVQRRFHVRRNRELRASVLACVAVLLVGFGVPTMQFQADKTFRDALNSSELRCPKPAGDLGDPKPTGDDRFVPEGASAVLLCSTTDEFDRPPNQTDRGPVLDQHVDMLVDQLNALPAYRSEGNGCTQQAVASVYDLVLGYPNGRQVVATYETRCGGIIRVGDEYRQDANGGVPLTGRPSITTTFFDLVERYGDASRPDNGEPVGLACPDPPGKWFGASAHNVSARHPFQFNGEFTEARLCDPNHPDARIVLDADETQQLMGKLAELPKASDMWFDCEHSGTTYDLLLNGPGMLTPLRFTFEDFGCHRISDDHQLRAGAEGLADYIRTLAGKGN